MESEREPTWPRLKVLLLRRSCYMRFLPFIWSKNVRLIFCSQRIPGAKPESTHASFRNEDMRAKMKYSRSVWQYQCGANYRIKTLHVWYLVESSFMHVYSWAVRRMPKPSKRASNGKTSNIKALTGNNWHYVFRSILQISIFCPSSGLPAGIMMNSPYRIPCMGYVGRSIK